MITVNGNPISEDRLYREMQYHPAESREGAMKQAAKALILGEVLRERAQDLGLSATDDEEPSGEEDFIEQLIEREVYYPQATDDECRHYFDTNRERFVTSPLLDTSHILVAADPEDEQERLRALETAESLIKQLHSDMGAFNRLAQHYSACSSAQSGGSLGQLTRGQTVPEFERPVFAAGEGLMPDPVETRYGYHVVVIHQRGEGHPMDFEQAQPLIQDYLNERVRRKAIAQYLNQLLANADIQGIDLEVDGSLLMQ